MYIRYIHKLYDLHLKAQNYTGTPKGRTVWVWGLACGNVYIHVRVDMNICTNTPAAVASEYILHVSLNVPTGASMCLCVPQRLRTPCCSTTSCWSGQIGRSESSSTTPCRASGKEKSICISLSSRTSTEGRWAWKWIKKAWLCQCRNHWTHGFKPHSVNTFIKHQEDERTGVPGLFNLEWNPS